MPTVTEPFANGTLIVLALILTINTLIIATVVTLAKKQVVDVNTKLLIQVDKVVCILILKSVQAVATARRINLLSQNADGVKIVLGKTLII